MGIFVDALKNGLVDYEYGNKDIVTSYNLGDGNHNVKLEGNNTSVRVGNGNSQISVDGDECAVLAGDGDHTISSVGDYNNIRTGNGNQTVVSYGDSSNITVGNGDNNIEHYGTGGIIRTGNGNNSLVSVGDGKVIQTGSGNDDVLMIGDYNIADFGDGDNNIVFYSNGSIINTGSGNDSITSLDQVMNNEDFVDFTSYIEERLQEKDKKVNVLTSKEVIRRTKKKHKLKKTTVRTTYRYTGYIDSYKQKVVGLQKTKINSGTGSDTISITKGKGTKIKADKTEKDTITKKKPYVYSEEYIGRKDWSFTKTVTTHEGRGSWLSGGVAGAVIGFALGGPIGIVIGASVGHDHY